MIIMSVYVYQCQAGIGPYNMVCFYASSCIDFLNRQYQLVAKSTVPRFLTRVIFTMSISTLWYAPAVPPELGAQRTFGRGRGHAKKNFRRFCTRIRVPQLQNRVGAYAQTCVPVWASKLLNKKKQKYRTAIIAKIYFPLTRFAPGPDRESPFCRRPSLFHFSVSL